MIFYNKKIKFIFFALYDSLTINLIKIKNKNKIFRALSLQIVNFCEKKKNTNLRQTIVFLFARIRNRFGWLGFLLH